MLSAEQSTCLHTPSVHYLYTIIYFTENNQHAHAVVPGSSFERPMKACNLLNASLFISVHSNIRKGSDLLPQNCNGEGFVVT